MLGASLSFYSISTLDFLFLSCKVSQWACRIHSLGSGMDWEGHFQGLASTAGMESIFSKALEALEGAGNRLVLSQNYWVTLGKVTIHGLTSTSEVFFVFLMVCSDDRCCLECRKHAWCSSKEGSIAAFSQSRHELSCPAQSKSLLSPAQRSHCANRR